MSHCCGRLGPLREPVVLWWQFISVKACGTDLPTGIDRRPLPLPRASLSIILTATVSTAWQGLAVEGCSRLEGTVQGGGKGRQRVVVGKVTDTA